MSLIALNSLSNPETYSYSDKVCDSRGFLSSKKERMQNLNTKKNPILLIRTVNLSFEDWHYDGFLLGEARAIFLCNNVWTWLSYHTKCKYFDEGACCKVELTLTKAVTVAHSTRTGAMLEVAV